MTVDGQVRGVDVTPERMTRGLDPVAAVSVTTPLRVPGTTDEAIGLTIARDGVMSGAVVPGPERPIPVRIEGLLQLDETAPATSGATSRARAARITAPEEVTSRWSSGTASPDG